MKTVSLSRLLALLCLLVSLVVPGIASASTASGAENRVWAFDFTEQVHVGRAAALTPELHRGCEPREYDLASDSPLAAGGGGRGRAAKGGVPKPRVKKMTPDPNAKGPHSTWKADGDGRVKGYAEWKPNSRNPSGFDKVKRVDLQGGSHYNKATGQDVPTPHTHGPNIPGGVRPANPSEIPGGGN